MAKKFYAVKNGKTPGIFETWDECKKSVDGYSGAVFKSFKTKDEALAFLGIESSSNSEIPIDVDGSITSDSSCATAYVDGSYNIATKEFGYGVVMFHNGEELHMSKSFSDAEMASMRNKRRKEQMGYKTNYSYLYNVICVHVNCGSARDGTILIKKSSGKNENTFYLEDFYFKNIIIIIYSTPQAFFASISAISLYLSPE